MSSGSASIQIPAGPDRMWQLIGGFDSAPGWLPFILRSDSRWYRHGGGA
jgi:hypothetical protein